MEKLSQPFGVLIVVKVYVILETYEAYGYHTVCTKGCYLTEESADAECTRLKANQKLTDWDDLSWSYEECEVRNG